MINIHKLIFSRWMEFKVTLNTPLDFWVVQTQILNKFVGKTLIKIYALKDERNVVPSFEVLLYLWTVIVQMNSRYIIMLR
jgi:hypothetical protein